MQTFTLNLSPFSTGVTDATFGRMQISTTISYQLVGTLATIEICYSSASCPSSPWASRNTYINSKLKIYENYWDLTTGTVFDRNAMKNPWKI